MIKASGQKWRGVVQSVLGIPQATLRWRFDLGGIPGMKSNMQEIFLLGLLRTHAAYSEISTSIFHPNLLKSLSVILGPFTGWQES